MPNCRNCGARLSKFDTDLCPVCGIKNPLEGTSSETVEITSQIDLSEMKEGQKVLRRRKKFIAYFFTLGFTFGLETLLIVNVLFMNRSSISCIIFVD